MDWRSLLVRALWRAGRAAAAVAISVFLVQLAGDPNLIMFAPILLAVDKIVRDLMTQYEDS